VVQANRSTSPKPAKASRTGAFDFLIPPDLTTERLSSSVTADGERRPPLSKAIKNHSALLFAAEVEAPRVTYGRICAKDFKCRPYSALAACLQRPRKIILQVHIVEEGGKQSCDSLVLDHC
jgi:hypothetical protein